MSIERAEADLALARVDVSRLGVSLESAKARMVRLEHYIEVARAYERGADGPSDDRGRGDGTLAEAATAIIRERGNRQPTRVLVDELEARGHQIGGANKITNLSSTLSRAPHLSANKLKGWGLKEWGDEEPTPPDRNGIPEAQIPY